MPSTSFNYSEHFALQPNLCFLDSDVPRALQEGLTICSKEGIEILAPLAIEDAVGTARRSPREEILKTFAGEKENGQVNGSIQYTCSKDRNKG